jgi:hypothetical protein
MDQGNYHRQQAWLYRDRARATQDREQRCHYLDRAAYHASQYEPPAFSCPPARSHHGRIADGNIPAESF